jgi:aspartate racemase
VQRDELDALTDYLNDHLRWMAAAGATIAAIPAVTPHICAPALAKIAPLPLVDIVDATRAALHRRGLKRVSLMGTRFAMESRFFGRIDGVEIVLPPPADVAFIHETYMGIVSSARTAPAAVDRLRHIARTMIDRDGVEAIVIAGTDLSLAFDEESAGFPALDCARVHLDALVEAMLRST